MSDYSKRFRLDFDMAIRKDEKTGEVFLALVPNPDRYEWKMINGEKMLYDKIDNFYIPTSAIDQMLHQAASQDIQIGHQPAEIQDAKEYVDLRRSSIVEQLEEKEEIPTFNDASAEFLESLAKDKLGFVIMSIDIVGSTKRANSSDPEEYKKVIKIMTNEMSRVVPKFHGHVLKYTGDGLIAYFPEPNFITKNDLALDCALTIHRLVYRVINPVFTEKSIKPVDIRIGLDSGEATVLTLGDPSTKQQKDIIGSVVSIACKIQSIGTARGITLGQITERNLHTHWRMICDPMPLPDAWPYNLDDEPYRVFRIRQELLDRLE